MNGKQALDPNSLKCDETDRNHFILSKMVTVNMTFLVLLPVKTMQTVVLRQFVNARNTLCWQKNTNSAVFILKSVR